MIISHRKKEYFCYENCNSLAFPRENQRWRYPGHCLFAKHQKNKCTIARISCTHNHTTLPWPRMHRVTGSWPNTKVSNWNYGNLVWKHARPWSCQLQGTKFFSNLTGTLCEERKEGRRGQGQSVSQQRLSVASPRARAKNRWSDAIDGWLERGMANRDKRRAPLRQRLSHTTEAV